MVKPAGAAACARHRRRESNLHLTPVVAFPETMPFMSRHMCEILLSITQADLGKPGPACVVEESSVRLPDPETRRLDRANTVQETVQAEPALTG